MKICKAPTLRLKALNKHTHIMYIIFITIIDSQLCVCLPAYGGGGGGKNVQTHHFQCFIVSKCLGEHLSSEHLSASLF